MKPPLPIPFTKMSGTGNDFIIIDHRRSFLNDIDLVGFVKAVCRRKFSVGADGLILIENSETADFRWRFFNGDGSAAEMCGNGARCAARFAFVNGIAPAAMRFQTVAGEIEAQVTDGSVKIRLTSPENILLNRKIELAGNGIVLHSINTGVPHAVMLSENVGGVPVADWGRIIRYHEMFQPAGTNANFIQVLSEKALKVRTYERGVEGETMACGTGAVAAALVAGLLGRVTPPVEVTTSGGEQLVIHFTMAGEPGNTYLDFDSGIFLEGPAHFIYDGQLAPDALI